MPALFVSHASKDDAAASALEAWLLAKGFTDIFVDHISIAAGDRWRDDLRAAARACRVFVCLVTQSWLDSYECFAEFRAISGYSYGKRTIPLFLLPPTSSLDEEARRRLAAVCAEDQGIDLGPCLDPNGNLDLDTNAEIANRLMVGLRAAGADTRVGLDPDVFAIDTRLRPTPFPGLESFGDEDADAALFYGRSGEIAHVLEELRKMRAERDQRAFVILGASGAGKSSLLKAGIIPRLRREVPAWLPLRAFRPGADPLLNFAEGLSKTLADFGKVEAHGIIRDRLSHVWSKADRNGNGELTAAGLKSIESELEAEGHKLREAANRMSASILISVDQAEEIARTESESGEALADFLSVASLAPETSWLLAFTVRTDSFHEFQSHRRFRHLVARPFDLRTVRIFRLENIVEEPAKRYKVRVDHDLVDALMEDAPKEDALPLLAFALQRLWRQYAASGALTRDNYEKIGGIKALIEDAAERALRGLEADAPLPSAPPSKRVIDLGAATFVPPLAQINEQGATIRRIAKWASFDDEQQELLLRFDRWRLVIRKGKEEAGGGTVEVAHEALFREWTQLKSWLEPERARLDALRSLEIDASTWDRNGRDAAFLTHRETHLAQANALAGTEGYRKRLGEAELDYLAACQAAEQSAHKRALRVQGLLGMLAESEGKARRLMSSATNTQALTQTGVVVDGRTAGCDCTCDRDRHLFCSGPKRMLALDGGGVRGAITVAFLEQIEAVLSEHLKKPAHLGNWFDLIGGTSTGAIIAGALAMGFTTADIKRFYFELAPKVFKRPFWRVLGLQAKYDARMLRSEIEEIVGDLALSSEELVTGLCMISKRIDTGSPWVLANNPRSLYWETKPGDKGGKGHIGNKHYPLCNLVRASTAAPFYFDPETISIVEGEEPGVFMDGGVTPHNNPSLRMLLLAVLGAHKLSWKTGPEHITIVSIGTGSHRDQVIPDELGMGRTAKLVYRTALGLMSDIKTFVLVQMQYLGECLTPWTIDSEIGALCGEAPPGGKMFQFMRYDVQLELPWIEEHLGEDVEKEFGRRLTEIDVLRMRSLDDPTIIEDIYKLGRIAARKQVKPEHWTGELATWCQGCQPSAAPRHMRPRKSEDAVGRTWARYGKAISRSQSYLRSRVVRRFNPTAK